MIKLPGQVTLQSLRTVVGVQQGCLLPPVFFNIFFEKIEGTNSIGDKAVVIDDKARLRSSRPSSPSKAFDMQRYHVFHCDTHF